MGAPSGPLRVELEHGSTGTVAKPVEVKVRVRRTTTSMQEIRVQVLLGDGGHGSDKFFISGPTSTQALMVSSTELESEVVSAFSLVPLKPGLLAVPRVQVTSGSLEVVSS